MGYPPLLSLHSTSFISRFVERSQQSIASPIHHLLHHSLHPFNALHFRVSVKWDQEIDLQLAHDFLNLLSDLNSLSDIKMVRTLPFSAGTSVTLNLVVDASMKAYGTVAYGTVNGKSHFIMAKARVAPIKTLTLPQLELMAILLACKLSKYIIETFEGVQFSEILIFFR